MTTPCGTTERSIRSTAGMCGQECAKPGCVSSSAWTRPSRCSSRGAMCACGAASRRCTEGRRPKRRKQSPHVRPASPKKRALGWRTSLSGLAHLCTRLSRYPMLVGEHRCPRPKTKGAPGKSGPAIFALKISEDRCSRASPKQICPQNQNPQNGHLMARFDWGLSAVCFGANPVAAVFESAPGSATPPEHRIYFKPTSQEALLKQDISTLLGIGHFYFALTGGWRQKRTYAMALKEISVAGGVMRRRCQVICMAVLVALLRTTKPVASRRIGHGPRVAGHSMATSRWHPTGSGPRHWKLIPLELTL